MAHESGPHRLFAIDQLSSRPGVSPLRRALSGRQPIPSSPFALGPKEQDATGPRLTIPVSVLQGVEDKTTHLYFWGWLIYQDVFPNTPVHISMFCMELTDVRGSLVAGTTYQFNWSLCSHHNCADDECKGEPYNTPSKIWPN